MKSIIELAREAGFATSWTEAAGQALERFAALLKDEWLKEAGEMPEPVGHLDDITELAEFMSIKLREYHTERKSSTPRAFTIPVVTLTQCQQAAAAAVARKDAELAQTHTDWVRCDKAFHAIKAKRDELKALVNQQLTTEQVQRAKQALYDASHGDIEATDAEVKAAISVAMPYVWP